MIHSVQIKMLSLVTPHSYLLVTLYQIIELVVVVIYSLGVLIFKKHLVEDVLFKLKPQVHLHFSSIKSSNSSILDHLPFTLSV
jgi:hypothetical protein